MTKNHLKVQGTFTERCFISLSSLTLEYKKYSVYSLYELKFISVSKCFSNPNTTKLLIIK